MTKLTSKNRGLFIVFEGGDRCGKSSQISLLKEKLQRENHQVKIIKFPNRESKSGVLIDSYLKQSRSESESINDQTIHLLFSANRWEMKQEIESLLESGTTLLVDRYSHSGIAYSFAKGLDIEWCRGCDRGLPLPDIVFYFSLSPQKAASRGDYGVERYETISFQEKVAASFQEIFKNETNCVLIDADRSIDTIASDVYNQFCTQFNQMSTTEVLSHKIPCTLWKS